VDEKEEREEREMRRERGREEGRESDWERALRSFSDLSHKFFNDLNVSFSSLSWKKKI
jgi:hypothetical protein